MEKEPFDFVDFVVRTVPNYGYLAIINVHVKGNVVRPTIEAFRGSFHGTPAVALQSCADMWERIRSQYETMYCPHCGDEVTTMDKQAGACRNCGKRYDVPAEPVADPDDARLAEEGIEDARLHGEDMYKRGEHPERFRGE